jgi:hypothetical protein
MRLLSIAVLCVSVASSAVGQVQQQAAAAQQEPGSAELVAKAQLEGQAAAKSVGTAGWFGSGVASGVLLGLIGTGVTWAIAGSSDVNLPPEQKLLVANQPVAFQLFYEKEYAAKVKSRRKSSALKGGLIGTAAFVLLYASSR